MDAKRIVWLGLCVLAVAVGWWMGLQDDTEEPAEEQSSDLLESRPPLGTKTGDRGAGGPGSEPGPGRSSGAARDEESQGDEAPGRRGVPGPASRPSADVVPSSPEASDTESEDPDEPDEPEELEEPEEMFTGSLGKEAIDDGVRDQIPDIHQCYQAWLERNPSLEGRLEVTFVIAESEDDPELGVVREADIEDSTVDHVWMEGCVLSAMEDAEFPAPEGGGAVRVNYPFHFSSSDD